MEKNDNNMKNTNSSTDNRICSMNDRGNSKDTRNKSMEDDKIKNYERVKGDNPVPSSDATKNEDAFDSYDYLGNSCSAWDCTGLIPSAPQSEAELESYEDLYRFEAPRMAPEKDNALRD